MTDNTTDTLQVSLTDPNLLTILADRLNPAFTKALEDTADKYRGAFADVKRASQFNVKDRAHDLWLESGDSTVDDYNDMVAEVERLTEELKEAKATASEFAIKASANFVEEAKAESPVDPKEAKAAVKNVSAGFLQILALALGAATYKDVDGITFTDLPSSAKASNPIDAAQTEHNRKVREWAAENGIDVSTRGRIAQDVYDAYNEAHS